MPVSTSGGFITGVTRGLIAVQLRIYVQLLAPTILSLMMDPLTFSTSVILHFLNFFALFLMSFFHGINPNQTQRIRY
jgi:hypothetical protein